MSAKGRTVKTDVCNAPVSLEDGPALESWNAMIRAFLAHGTATPQHLGAVLAAQPDFAMGQAARGLFSLLMGRAEMWQVAEDARIAAHKGAAQAGLHAFNLFHGLTMTDSCHDNKTTLSLDPHPSIHPPPKRVPIGELAGQRRVHARVNLGHDAQIGRA